MVNESIPTPNPEVKKITGERYGRLVVQSYHGTNPRGHALWNCICDCGNTKISTTGDLRRGSVKSCGCFRRDKARADHTTHGMTKTKEFRIWSGIKTRTRNKNAHEYPKYGAKGIEMCDKWHDSFEAFLSDMGPIPEGKTSIDRIDNSRGYEPGNCRWADAKEQAQNRGNNIFIEHNGERLCLSDWAKRYGIHRSTLRRRVLLGWDFEQALTYPIE